MPPGGPVTSSSARAASSARATRTPRWRSSATSPPRRSTPTPGFLTVLTGASPSAPGGGVSIVGNRQAQAVAPHRQAQGGPTWGWVPMIGATNGPQSFSPVMSPCSQSRSSDRSAARDHPSATGWCFRPTIALRGRPTPTSQILATPTPGRSPCAPTAMTSCAGSGSSPRTASPSMR